MLRFLRVLIELIENSIEQNKSSCHTCGCNTITHRIPNFDSEKVTYECGCIMQYVSNFPGVIRVSEVNPCMKGK